MYIVKLAFGQICYQKKRNISIFLALVLAIFLILEVFFILNAYQVIKIQDAKENGGEFYVHITSLSGGQYESLQQDFHVEKLGAVSKEKTVKILTKDISIAGKNGTFCRYAMDKQAFSLSKTKLLYGRLPQKEGEVLVSSGMKKGNSFLYQVLSKGEASDKIKIKNGEETKICRIVGVVDDMKVGKEENICNIIEYEEEIPLPKEVYLTTEKSSRQYIKNWLESMGYDYHSQVYDTTYMNKYSLSYTGDYEVELNNTLLDAMSGSSTEQGVVLAKRLGVILPFVVVIVAILTLSGMLSMELEMSRRENGVLRLCGFSPELFCGYYLWKSVLLFVPACILALMLSVFGNQFVVFLAQKARVSELSNLKISFQRKAALPAVLILFLTTLLGTVIPAISSIREDVVTMLKGTNPAFQPTYKKKTKRKSHKIKGFYEWKIAGNLLSSHKLRTAAVICSLILISSLAATYIICFQVVQQKLQDQKESYRSEFSLLGDGNVDAYSLLAKIPYVSWSNVMYDSITEYEPENIQMNDMFPESSYEYWKDDEKMQIETSSMSQWFYETYIREDNNTLPTYKELVAKKQGVLCDRGNATQQGEKVTGNVFSETLPSSLKQKNGTNISLAGRGVVKDDACVEGDTMPLLFVPDKVYLESCTPFYTIIYLNVQEGKEQEAREWFVEHKDDLDVTVGDRVTEYLEARDTSGMLQSILLAALIILAVIGIVNLSNTFAMDVQMQQKDYAIMRTLGMSRFHITRIVFAECFWYVAVGLVGSGLYMVLLLPKVLNRLLEIQLLGKGYVLILSLKLSAFILVFTMCMGLVFLYRQMRQGTTEILRKE